MHPILTAPRSVCPRAAPSAETTPAPGRRDGVLAGLSALSWVCALLAAGAAALPRHALAQGEAAAPAVNAAPAAPAATAAAVPSAASVGPSAGGLRLGALLEGSASDRGFSYFIGLGQQVQRYEERASLVDARSHVITRSPMLVAGALYALGPDLLFSMDSLSTFAPGRGHETWRAGSTQFQGQSLQDTLLQTNQYSLSTNQVTLAGHRRLQPAAPWFGSAGLGFRNLAFKRFGFAAGPDHAVNLPTDRTVSEDSSELLLHAGLSLDSEQVVGAPTHYGARLSLGVPVWRRVENSYHPLNRYTDSFGGWDLALEGRYSVALLPQVHLGGWARLASAQRRRIVDDAGATEVPRSRLDSLSWGLEMLWKL